MSLVKIHVPLVVVRVQDDEDDDASHVAVFTGEECQRRAERYAIDRVLEAARGTVHQDDIEWYERASLKGDWPAICGYMMEDFGVNYLVWVSVEAPVVDPDREE